MVAAICSQAYALHTPQHNFIWVGSVSVGSMERTLQTLHVIMQYCPIFNRAPGCKPYSASKPHSLACTGFSELYLLQLLGSHAPHTRPANKRQHCHQCSTHAQYSKMSNQSDTMLCAVHAIAYLLSMLAHHAAPCATVMSGKECNEGYGGESYRTEASIAEGSRINEGIEGR